MKLNITVDVDWIGEDGNIEDEVKASIIQGVKNSISKQCLSNVEQQTQAMIDEGLKTAIESIDKKVITFVEDWLNNEVTITDAYGDAKECGTLTDIIKSKFTHALNKKVDDNGRGTKYGNSSTVLEYLTGKKVSALVESHLKSYNKEMDKKISELVERGIKERVSDKFAQMVIGYAKQDHKNQQALEN